MSELAFQSKLPPYSRSPTPNPETQEYPTKPFLLFDITVSLKSPFWGQIHLQSPYICNALNKGQCLKITLALKVPLRKTLLKSVSQGEREQELTLSKIRHIHQSTLVRYFVPYLFFLSRLERPIYFVVRFATIKYLKHDFAHCHCLKIQVMLKSELPPPRPYPCTYVS